MRPIRDLRDRQKSIVIVAMILFAMVLLLLQLWLFVAVLENLLGGHTAMAIPAAAASVAILIVNIWMLRGIFRLDHSP